MAKYSEAEKKAFAAGKAYATAKQNKRVKCKTKAEKESFRAGVKAARGKK